MKKTNLMFIALAIVFACCTNKQEVAPTGRATLSLTGSAGSIVATKATIDLLASTNVGVYALQTGATPTTLVNTPFKNAPYTATGIGGAFTSTAPFVLESAKAYNVCAYAPRQATAPSDASAVSFAHGADVLYAPNTPVSISGTVASAVLSFEHKMSQIKFMLASGVGAPILTGATINVTGFNESCTLNLADGTIIPVVGAGATVTDIAKAVCFAPNATSMVLNLTVTTSDNRVFYGTISATFLASRSYTYTLTLNKNDAQLGITGTVVDWIPVDGGNVSVAG